MTVGWGVLPRQQVQSPRPCQKREEQEEQHRVHHRRCHRLWFPRLHRQRCLHLHGGVVASTGVYTSSSVYTSASMEGLQALGCTPRRK